MKSTSERTTWKDTKEGPAAPCTIAKAYGEPYVNCATKVMLGAKLKDFQFIRRTAEDGYAIKVPVFSPPYGGFPNVDKSLGPEMKSRPPQGFHPPPWQSPAHLAGVTLTEQPKTTSIVSPQRQLFWSL